MVQVCHLMARIRTFIGADIGNHLLNRWIEYCSDSASTRPQSPSVRFQTRSEQRNPGHTKGSVQSESRGTDN
ncbi:hypothetical protein DPMN_069871 [Dreissena polymorpha]|uniref:Uncharacterized protein n=1 Tax=Dreissena polymorpha TaxID=45954 RepID=A0A9D3YZU1_DREPO|nr:hypothetical protein DPMN_069871 [Dreissena polymorpha]